MKRNYSTAGLQSSGYHPQCETLRSRISTSIESATQASKGKKRCKKQLQQIDDELSAIEMQREALEDAKRDAAVLEALKSVSDAVKAAQQKNADKMRDLDRDIEEQGKVAKKFSQDLENLHARFLDFDEDKLEHQSAELLQKQRDKKLSGVGPSVYELPSTYTTDFAKPTPTKRKAAATQASKGKKRCKKQLQQIDEELSAIEMQREPLEEAKRNAAVLETMKKASDAVKAAQQHKNVNQMRDLERDLAEPGKVAMEVSQGFKNLHACLLDFDEDKVERELEQILQEQLDRELWGVGPSVDELASTSTTDFAKRTPTKRKAAATQASKGKKRCKKQLQQIDEELSAIEMQREPLEEAKRNAAVLETMKKASDAVKAAQQHKNVDQMRDLERDLAEPGKVAMEVSQGLKNLHACLLDFDEDKVERELEQILQEQLDRELWGVGPSVDELASTSTTDFAKRTPTKRKAAATQASKGKKRCKKQLQQIDEELSAIEMQREPLEEAKRNAAVLETMKKASDAVKAAQQHKNVDQMRDLERDLAEPGKVAKEVSQGLKNLHACLLDFDEDKLEHESEEVPQEQHDKKLSGVGPSVDELPSIPTTDNAKPTPTKSEAGKSKADKSKAAATQASKRKELYEDQHQKNYELLCEIEMQREALEDEKRHAAVLEDMKSLSDAISAGHQKNADQLRDLERYLAEQRKGAKELYQAISKLATFGEGVDEDKLEHQSEELLQKERDKKLSGVGPSVYEVPSTSTTDFAKPTPTKRKAAATQASKGKKRCKKQLQQIDEELSAIEMQREPLEEAKRNAAVLETMKKASDAVKAAQQPKNVDQMRDLERDLAEPGKVAKEVSQGLKNLHACLLDFDEDKLEHESEEVLQEQHDKKLSGVGPSVDELPSIPTTDNAKPTPTKSKAGKSKAGKSKACNSKAGKSKAAATQASKRKELYEDQHQKNYELLCEIEMQREALEDEKRHAAVLEDMKSLSDAISAGHQKNADQLRDLERYLAEQRKGAKELYQAISKLATFGEGVDEDKLEHQSEELLQKERDKKLSGVGPSVYEVPSTSTTDFAKPTPTKRKAGFEREERCKKQLQQIDDALSVIEKQRVALEEAKTNAAVLEALKNASEAQEAAQQDKDVDQMRDIAEHRNVAKEISEAISNLAASGPDVYEDVLEREPEELLREELHRELLDWILPVD